MAERARLWLLTLLNLGALLTLVFVILDRFPATRFPLADYGALFGSLALFLVIPPGLAAAALLRLVSERPGRWRRRAYFSGSYVFLAVAWLSFTTPGVFMLELWQPWPLSLKQGPDTEYARESYATRFGQPPPATVSGVYYRGLAIMGESEAYLRFTYEDPALVMDMVARFELIEVTREERNGALVGFVQLSRDKMSWWPADRINAADVVFVDRGTHAIGRGEKTDSLGRGTRRILWWDRAGRTVFYEEQRE